jgi:tripartite-type tricarboxylate transporter receptor subunit TctC
VALATTSPLLAVTPTTVPAKDLREFIAYAKASPGKLNYGSSGPGSSPHLATELFISLTGAQMTHIAYKGIAPATTALLANEVQFSLVPIAVGMPHVKSGRLRALATCGPVRSAATPDVPTSTEAGVPGLEVIAWWGMLAPAKTPAPVVTRLNREIRAILDNAEVRRGLVDQGMDPAGGEPAEFAALIKADMEKWGEIGRRLGVRLD